MPSARHAPRRSAVLRPVAALALAAIVGAPGVGHAQTPAPSVTGDRVHAAAQQLDQVAHDVQAKTAVPGMAIGIVYGDEVVYLKGLGVREVGQPETVDADTVFQLASLSKPIASTVVAGVVGSGLASWDDPVVMHDPDFALADSSITQSVTLRDMFAHRSGLFDHAGDLLEDLGFDRATILHRLRYVPLDNRFRAAYAYTNYGLTEAAVAAARAATTTWEDLAASRLYQPAGMPNTSSHYADYLAAPNRAALHVKVGNTWQPREGRDPDAQSPAGGVSSTVRDLTRWLRLQLNDGMLDGKQVIDADPLAETHRPQMIMRPPSNPATDRASFYGLGWNVSYDDQGEVLLGHSGAFNSGAATAVYLLPADKLGIVVLTNGAPVGAPEAVALSFLDLARFGKVQRDYLTLLAPVFAAINQPPYGNDVDWTRPPAQPRPAADLGAYTGTYRNDFYGPVQIQIADAGLSIGLGPDLQPFSLTHFDADTFTYQPVGENAYGPSGVTFSMGGDGTAIGMRIDILDHDGEGNVTGLGQFARDQAP
ncbi:MAG: serine hydrolase [Chloroflexi bacterium]|nr:serine hydrolase [Chloroflexota bacterium]